MFRRSLFFTIAALLLGFAPVSAQLKSEAAPTGTAHETAAPASVKHAVTVTFNYDFTRTPACSDKVKKHCIEQFVVYDVSGGAKKRIKLFAIPVPAGATKSVNGITGKSPELDFEPGRHELAVTAEMNDGVESSTLAATVWIVVPAADSSPGAASPKN
jgi:hypothetical protein